MARTLALALLPLLAVSMVTTAAPLAEQQQAATRVGEGEEVAVGLNGDSASVGIAKRAKEIIVFGNQQNSVRLGAVKKASAEPQPPPPPPQQQQQEPMPLEEVAPAAPQQTPVEAQKVVEVEPEQPSAPVAADGVDGGDVAQEASGQAEVVKEPEQGESSVVEEAGPSQGASSDGLAQDLQEPQGAQQQEEIQPVPVEGGAHSASPEEEEAVQQQQANEEVEEEEEDSAVPQLLVPVEEGGEHSAQQENIKESEEAQQQQQQQQPAEAPVPAPGDPSDQTEESEEALQSLDQPENNEGDEDEMESLLKDLHDNDDDSSNGIQTESSSGEAGVKTEEEDEGSAERELMQVNDQMADANGEDRGYTQSLLKYILSHGEGYGRLPQTSGFPMYPAASDPYSYLQRRRRSSASRSALPHIHRRRRGNNDLHSNDDEKELSRAKRTKRDLFDDNLYYNANLGGYDPREAEEEEEEKEEEEAAEKNAELQELITYLMALYPALYGDNQRPEPQFPAYLWEGAKYPQEDELEEPYWVPEPYQEPYQEPQMEWEEPELETPAWEPSFYPEEVEQEEEEEENEEPNYYPVLAKRQMMSFVPGERRKRYFFPFAREPYTHWGAFVPSQKKRDYFGQDPYRRLKELALVLAEDDRGQPSYLIDTEEGYQKK